MFLCFQLNLIMSPHSFVSHIVPHNLCHAEEVELNSDSFDFTVATPKLLDVNKSNIKDPIA